MKTKKNIKRLGIEDGRVAYEVTIRKDHFEEDYAEMVRIQESSNGKRRFYVHFEAFSEKEIVNKMKLAFINNNFRNSFLRKDYYVNYSSMTLNRYFVIIADIIFLLKRYFSKKYKKNFLFPLHSRENKIFCGFKKISKICDTFCDTLYRKAPEIGRFQGVVVESGGLEPPTSRV